MKQEEIILKVNYNKKQVRASLIFGLVWLLLGIAGLLFSHQNYFMTGYSVLGILYFGNYIYLSRTPYVIITKRMIKVNGFPPKQVLQKDITSVKYFAGDFTIKSASKKLVIDTNYVDKEGLLLLKDTLDPMLLKDFTGR